MPRALRRILTLSLTGLVLTGMATVVAADGDAAPAGPYYNETQATRGEMQYRAHCAACHGAELEGDRKSVV